VDVDVDVEGLDRRKAGEEVDEVVMFGTPSKINFTSVLQDPVSIPEGRSISPITRNISREDLGIMSDSGGWHNDSTLSERSEVGPVCDVFGTTTDEEQSLLSDSPSSRSSSFGSLMNFVERGSFKRTILNNENNRTTWPYCADCKAFKPIRTHHCRRCKKCTLKMDHHCMWITNCVGYYNHKFFFLTLLSSFLGCLFIIVLSVLRCILDTQWHLDIDHPIALVDFCIFILSSIGAIIQAWSIGGMFFFHCYLISRNMTHIEHNCCRGKGPCHFNRGFCRNIRDVLGNNFLLWLVPIHSKPKGWEGDEYEPVPEKVKSPTQNGSIQNIGAVKCCNYGDFMTACCQCLTCTC